MSHSFMSPLQTFTLETLVALEQWAAIQAVSRRRTGANREKPDRSKELPRREFKPKKHEL